MKVHQIIVHITALIFIVLTYATLTKTKSLLFFYDASKKIEYLKTVSCG
ncbi:Uncharacterised protein [Klebsiella pneumoniae]|nr:Uncharacterised protein [Klebsiella pneumoniae]